MAIDSQLDRPFDSAFKKEPLVDKGYFRNIIVNGELGSWVSSEVQRFSSRFNSSLPPAPEHSNFGKKREIPTNESHDQMFNRLVFAGDLFRWVLERKPSDEFHSEKNQQLRQERFARFQVAKSIIADLVDPHPKIYYGEGQISDWLTSEVYEQMSVASSFFPNNQNGYLDFPRIDTKNGKPYIIRLSKNYHDYSVGEYALSQNGLPEMDHPISEAKLFTGNRFSSELTLSYPYDYADPHIHANRDMDRTSITVFKLIVNSLPENKDKKV